MMYPRLVLARDLLSDDGALFVSIDERELQSLQAICDEVFGSNNRVATFVWTKTSTPPSLSNKNRKTVEYLLAYEKRADSSRKYFGSKLDNGDAPLLNSGNPIRSLRFPRGSIRFTYMLNGTVSPAPCQRVRLDGDLLVENGVNATDVTLRAEFKWSQPMLDAELEKGTYLIVKSEQLSMRFQRQDDGASFKAPNNNLELNKASGVGTNEKAVSELDALGLSGLFDYPKPTSLVKSCLSMLCKTRDDALVLDFFSGSSSTAHAVMHLNAEDGGNRKFIMVQLPEVCDEKSEAAKAGYKNICEIGKERIRRAGAKIAAEVEESNAQLKLGEEPKKVPDIGFRVLKIDSSNFEDVQRTPDAIEQSQLFGFADNLKSDRMPEDILFQLLPKFQIPYTARIEKLNICGKTVYSVDDDALLACFDRDVPEDAIRIMAARQPLRAVLRDASFVGDDALANFEEIFKTLSPETETRVV